MLEKFGFKPHINKKYGIVKAMCSYELAKKLLEMESFNTNENKERLRYFIRNIEASAK